MKLFAEPDSTPGGAPAGSSDELTLEDLDMVVGGLAQEWWADHVWQIRAQQVIDPEQS